MSKINDLIKELCPNGVGYKPFFNVAKYIRGITYNKSNETEQLDSYKVLRANNITLNSNKLNFGDVKKIHKTVRIKEEQWLKKGDILICAGSGSKEHIGKVAYISHNIDYTFGGFMGVIRCSELINSSFMFHILTSNIFREHIGITINSTTINNINNQTFENFNIPCPPIEVQEEIVKILDKFGELEAELEAELEMRNRQYEFWRRNLLKGSNRYVLGDVAKFIYGFTNEALDSGDARYIRITDISENGYLLSTDSKYLNITEDNRKYLLNKGDIVVARTGASFGKTLYFNSDYPGIYASFLIKIELDTNIILNRYYWHFSKSSLYWMQANNLVSRAGQPQFNSNAIKKIEICVPSIEKQKIIIEILDKFDKLINDINEGIPAEIDLRRKQYEYYRNKLLSFEELKVND